MSFVGFDFGNESGVVAVARQGGIDVVLNDESKCETPALVCFAGKERFVDTISQIKRLIGRQFLDPQLQRDIKSLPFSVTQGPDGYPLINAPYLGEIRSFTPTQVLGMVFSDLKIIAEKNLNGAVVDCCIGIPIYFTDPQRRAVLDAATIAGLHQVRLIHETTATALAYAIYNTDLPENDQLNVAFIDIGHASMQVCVAGLKKGQLKILAHAFDPSLGGRDFDQVLFQHFVEKFKTDYKIDVNQNARACLTLRAACEKLNKVLSANPEAPLNIERLMDKKDVKGFIRRDEFEQISIPILERVKKPLEIALSEAGLTVDNIYAVEVVGSGSCIPAIMTILTEFFGKEPRRTMNASEGVAKGCALQCAILSPTSQVREFQVYESFPFSIALSWKGDSENGAENQQSTIVFPKGNSIPRVKALIFYRSGTFSVDVHYADVSELEAPPKNSTYMIGPFQSTKGERAKVKVKVRLNLHGVVSIESATLLEEEEVEIALVKQSTKMETDEVPSAPAPSSTAENYGNMEDARSAADAPVSAFGAQGDIPVQMETDSKADVPKMVKKTDIPVTELVYGGMTPANAQKAVDKDPSKLVQLHQKVKSITWALSVVKKKDRTPIKYAAGFCVSNEGLIMTCAQIFEGLKLNEIEIRARRLDVDKVIIAEILHVKKEWNIAIVKVEGDDCEAGVFVANNSLCSGQPLLCIGHLLHSVGSFRLGRVAYNTEEYVREPKEEDKELRCESYDYEAWEYIPAYRSFGDIWNSKVFQKLEKSKSGNFEFEKQLQPHVPVIHCNGFLQNDIFKGLKTYNGCWGAPIFNLRGEIAGMLVSRVSKFEIGIHVSALRIFKDGFTMKGVAPKEARAPKKARKK